MPDITSATMIQNAKDDLATMEQETADFKSVIDAATQRINALEKSEDTEKTDQEIAAFEAELDQTLANAALNLATNAE